MAINEIVSFPADGWTLHGIFHPPRKNTPKRVGVILFHENYNSKFGTHRLFRDFGDVFADEGFYVLRYDDRGMCDSPGQREVTFADRLDDARAAVAFFRTQYRLDIVIGWGLCLGAAVALHLAVENRNKDARLDGLALCSIVADPGIVSLPQFGYERVEISKMAQEYFLRGNVLRKLWNAPRHLNSYAKKIGVLTRRYLRPDPPELGRLKKAIGQVGGVLAGYEGPTMLLFGDQDSYLTDFVERVNPGDKLNLKGKRNPPAWILMKDADHTFASRQKTLELFRHTINWSRPFLEGQLPCQSEQPTYEYGSVLKSELA